MYNTDKLINFLKENPVWFLWIAGSFSAVGAMGCLIAYLSAFDKSLIWLIEINDILKIAVVFAGVVVSLWYSMHGYYLLGFDRDRLHWIAIILVCFGGFFVLLDVVLDIYRNGSNALFYILLALGMYFFYLCIISLKNVKYDLENIGFVPMEGFIPILFLLLFTVIFGGHLYGVYVRDVAKHKLVVDYEKEKGNVYTIEHAGLVLMLTHHTVFTAGGKYLVVRTPDIIQIAGE